MNQPCPVCGGDRSKDITNTRDKIRAIGVISEHCDPGGRELRVKGFGTIRLSDMCNACDEAVLIDRVLRFAK